MDRTGLNDSSVRDSVGKKARGGRSKNHQSPENRDTTNMVLHDATPCDDIQFVLPRPSLKNKHNNVEQVPFLFPGQPVRRSVSKEKTQQVLSKTDQVRVQSQSNSKSRKQLVVDVTVTVDINCSKSLSLIRSVEEAVKDKVGRRPRTNSTDGELNLPQRGLCDENIVLQTYKWDMKKLLQNRNGKSPSPHTNMVPPPRGFVNLGNTCFLNATLQCLAYMPTLCQSITALPTSCYEINKGGKHAQQQQGQRITMFLRSLLRRVHGIEALEKGAPWKTSPIAPKNIHNAITSCRINGHRFRPGRQEDAHELLIHLFDAMHEGELFAAGINPHASGWRDKLPIRRLQETTFVHRIFGGYFQSQLHCPCGYKSNTYDPFLDLALEVSKKHITSLDAAFKEFMRKEKLDQNNRWKCSGCKKNVCPTKHLSVFRPPLSLCIHLKRFEFALGGSFNDGGRQQFGHRHSKGLSMSGNGGSKISKKIDFPALLCLPMSGGRSCQYLLTGVIIHVGKSATSGHYTAFVKQPGDRSKQWYHMDDRHTETVSEKTVLKQRDAYVLFYTRKEVKLEFPENVMSSSSGKGGSMSKKRPSVESPGNNPNASSAVQSPNSSNSAALNYVNGSSESTPGSKLSARSTKGNLAGVRKSLNYNSREKSKVQSNKRRTWSPCPVADKLDPGNDNTLLLGSINAGFWNGGDDSPPKDLLRSTALKKMEHKARSRKKKRMRRPAF
mmetsp:Transcript_11307/g.20765  ORF Transcript_11307/g.20765 Transcript_11307/m.20765 type:complete len:723 (-) Transcript_11307:113-2281(-)